MDDIITNLAQRLLHHEAMVIKLQDRYPDIAYAWLQGADLLRAKIKNLGKDPDLVCAEFEATQVVSDGTQVSI